MTILDSNVLSLDILDPLEIGLESSPDFGFPDSDWATILIRPPGSMALNVTKEAKGLVFRSNMLGFYEHCQFTLPRQYWTEHPELKPYSDVEVWDGDLNVFTGRLENPSSQDQIVEGSRVTVEAFGWYVHASDDQYEGIAIIRSLNRYAFSVYHAFSDPNNILNELAHQKVSASNYGPELMMSNPLETDSPPVVAGNSWGQWGWGLRGLYDASNGIKRVVFGWNASRNTSDIQMKVLAHAETGGYTELYSANWTTAFTEVDVTCPDDTDAIFIQAYYFPNTLNSLPRGWCRVAGIDGRGPAIYVGLEESTTYRIARQVAAAACPKYDITGVAYSSLVIDQIDYSNPQPPGTIFTDVLQYGPTNYYDTPWTWGVWEKMSNGKYRFVLGPISNALDYYLNGVELPTLGQDYSNVYNKAIVRYTDAAGVLREQVRTQYIQHLTDVGITRTLVVDQLDGVSDVWAQRYGDYVLAQHKYPSYNGEVVVKALDVRDFVTKGPIPFWRMIHAVGKRIMIGDARSWDPSSGADAPWADNHVFLIQEVEVDKDAGTARLTFDQPTDRLDLIMARLAKRMKQG
jgi:hypothetical protein